MSLNTPVVLIIFKRPDTTEKVFQQIREVQPKKLLVIADGPRTLEEEEKCQQARSVVEQVDWDCQVMKNYSDQNLGCRKRVSSGLDWVFSIVEEAIILEDDCVPHSSFFRYCSTLLDQYRHDDRVMAISGDNFQDGQKRTSYSYYFSKYFHCWGWASWRRAWQHWDFNPKKWLKFRDEGLLNSVCDSSDEVSYWENIFNSVFLEGKPDSWAYVFMFSCFSQGGLIALPNVNLVSNIGFGSEGTHTTNTGKYSSMTVNDLGRPIYHPEFIVRHKEADFYTFKYLFGGFHQPQVNTINRKLSKKLGLLKQKLSSISFPIFK